MKDQQKGAALVTGGTGFLGRQLVLRLLEQGRVVSVLARTEAPDLVSKGARFIQADLGDPAAIVAACACVQTVFHTAAKVGVWGRREEFEKINVQGTRAVIDGCRKHGVQRLVYTSTPSVIYNGKDLSGASETLPLTKDCPSPYPLSKARAEAEVQAAHAAGLSTVALRPHLIWGVGDPHLVPRVLERARAGRLRIVGEGRNRVDMVHVENAVDAHLLAEEALCSPDSRAGGKAYFITDGQPVILWDWINALLVAIGEPPVTRKLSLGAASTLGAVLEGAWSLLGLSGEPPMTRFVAAELAKDHWFDISAARRDLGYNPGVDLKRALAELVSKLKTAA